MFRFFLWNRRCCILRWLTFALLIKWAFDARVKICAPDCTCVNVTNNPSSELPQHGKRVRCLNPLTITNVEVIASKPLPLDTLYLDLSGNPLSILENGSFLTFTKLEKLNLATAQINIINPGSFTGLDNLRHLNLSNNNLRTISAPTFEGLTRLEKLYISGNQLTKLVNGTFDTLPALKYLDLSRNFLICDCHLSWILEWSKTFDVQLSTKTSCMFPKQLKGSRVHKLKQAQWHCNWPLQVPIFNLNPSESQVVFAGDSLKFGCQISNIDSTSRLSWTFNDKELKNISEDEIVTDIQVSSDGMMWMGVLNIPHLQPSHDGSWGCWLYSVEGNKTQSVEIRVLSEDTAFCPLSVTTGNKGRYVWPRTVEGVTVELPCWTPSVNHQGRQPPMVTRVCNDRGFWERLDTSRCPYISEVTKVLEQFAKANLNITSSSVIESVRHLKNYTGDGRVLKDKMDVVFIARTINNYLKFIPKHKEVAESLIDIMAVVMQLDERLLLEAQLEDTSCSKKIFAELYFSVP